MIHNSSKNTADKNAQLKHYLAIISMSVMCNIHFKRLLKTSMISLPYMKKLFRSSSAGNLHQNLSAGSPSLSCFIN